MNISNDSVEHDSVKADYTPMISQAYIENACIVSIVDWRVAWDSELDWIEIV